VADAMPILRLEPGERIESDPFLDLAHDTGGQEGAQQQLRRVGDGRTISAQQGEKSRV
jgi:hypothetical protein